MKITTSSQIIAFTKKYGVIENEDKNHNIYINRNLVVNDGWGGIEFIPHLNLWSIILKDKKYLYIFSWYLTLDVDSGCIWNNDILKKIVFILLN